MQRKNSVCSVYVQYWYLHVCAHPTAPSQYSYSALVLHTNIASMQYDVCLFCSFVSIECLILYIFYDETVVVQMSFERAPTTTATTYNTQQAATLCKYTPCPL